MFIDLDAKGPPARFGRAEINFGARDLVVSSRPNRVWAL